MIHVNVGEVVVVFQEGQVRLNYLGFQSAIRSTIGTNYYIFVKNIITY